MTETVQWIIKGVYIAMAVALAISNICFFFQDGKMEEDVQERKHKTVHA